MSSRRRRDGGVLKRARDEERQLLERLEEVRRFISQYERFQDMLAPSEASEEPAEEDGPAEASRER